jgi:general secretion pathway protein A
VVLIVDEAQNLEPQLLEQIRLLTNLETETQKLLQIILIGQPELRRLLAREDLRQIAQRVTGRYHLDPLTRAETAAYVRHRLRVAGATADIFTNGALREIHHISRGIPRVINIICDRALLGAYTQDQHQVPAALVRRASAEVFDQDIAPSWMPLLLASLAVLIVGGSGAVLWRYVPGWHRSASAPAAPIIASAPAAAAPDERTQAPPPVATGAVTAASVTADAAPAAAALAPELPRVLADKRASTDPDTAFHQLLLLWRANYTPGKLDGCSQALAQGLRCLTQRGSLAQLRQLNRPAILMLNDESGAAYQVVLRQLGDTTAQLQLGDQTVTVNLVELTRYWYGDFVLLWHPASRDVRDLSAGMRGSQVRQLRDLLAHWSGTNSADAPSDEYDASLVHLVEQFQRANRLQVDGIAGIETQIALDSALASPDSPLLQIHPVQQASTRGS